MNNDVNTLFFDVNKFYPNAINSTSLTVNNINTLSDDVKQFLCDNLLINGHSIFRNNRITSELLTFYINVNQNSQDVVYSFMLNNSYKENIELNLTLSIDNNTTFDIILNINSNLTFNTIYEKTGTPINTKHSSFMLARTNPKLTGNVKLVVDSDYHLYLDTFKVTDVLSNKKFRHQSIPSDGNYPRDIKAIFSSLPKGELFKVPEDSLNITKVYDDYDYQFNSVYEYGAETNVDRLYKENMKILAPLYIGHDNLPDFFCIFKLPKDIDYQYSDDTELIKQYFRIGDVVKIFDLRKYTTIGEYLNNYKKMLNDIQIGAHVQFLEQENKGTENSWKNGTDYWSGVSIDRGVLTSKMETTYFQNNIINNIGTNESLYGYILDGYERNSILYPNILNLEFMFNDEDASLYGINKYAGFYLKENDIINYGGVIKDTNKTSQFITKYDNSFNIIGDDSAVNSLLDDDSFDDRIKFVVTNDSVLKINNSQELNTYVSNNIINKPEKNIISVNATEVNLYNDLGLSSDTEDVYTLKYSDQKKSDEITQSFISMKFTKPLHYGEHLRIVTYRNNDINSVPIIYEIIASNDIRLVNVKDNISQYIQTNKRILNENVNSSVYFASSYNFDKQNLQKDYSADSPNVNINSIPNSSLFSYQEFDTNNKITQNKQQIADFPYYYLTWDSNEKAVIPTAKEEQLKFNKKDTLWTENHISDYPEIYRLAFYSQDLDDASQTASLSEQLKRIVQCLRKFNVEDFYVSSFSDDSLAIISENQETYFQHIDVPYLFNLFNSNYDNKDSIYYYSEKNDVRMYPLSDNTNKYDKDTYAFALYNFEMLGGRYSSVVKFLKFENFSYSLTKSIRNNDKMEDCLLALSFDANSTKYIPLKRFVLNSYNIDVNEDISTKHLITFDSARIIINPFNVNNDYVYSSSELILRDNTLQLYSPKSYSVSIMGVFGFKDFYTYFNLTNNKTYHSSNRISFSRGEDFKKYIKSGVLYKLISGSIRGVHINVGKTFYYMNDFIYYYADNELKKLKALTLIIGSNNTVIEVETENHDNFDFISKTPVINYDNLYSGSDKATNDLKYSISVPSIFVWESTGVYYDRNSDLDIANLNFFNSSDGYFTNMNYSLGNYDTDNFVFNNLNNTYVDANSNELISIKKALLDKSNTTENLIRQTLINNFNLKGSTAYYNKYINTLDFVYYGIKFTLKINNTDYLIDINLEDYNNYEVFVINSYNDLNKNEIYISTKEKIILLINNTYNKQHSGVINENIIYATNNNLNNVLNYNWLLSDYGVDVDNILCNGSKYFLETTSNNASIGANDILYQLYEPINNNGASYVFYLKNNIVDNNGTTLIKQLDNGFAFDYNYGGVNNHKLFVNTIGNDEFSDGYSEVINNDLTLSNNELNIYNNFFNTNYSTYIIKTTSENSLVSLEKNVEQTYGVSLNDTLLGAVYIPSTIVVATTTQPPIVITTEPPTQPDTTTYVETTTAPQNDGEIQKNVLFDLLKSYGQGSWLNSNLSFNVIGENNIITYNVSETYQPIIISIDSYPQHIKYNYDYYEPKFVDLIDFNLKEDVTLIEYCDKNFLLSNTSIKNVNTLPMYTGIKVFKSIPNFTLDRNFFIGYNKSIVKSIWTQNLYRLYQYENEYNNVQGYATGEIGGKNLLGSMCINLPQLYENVVDLSTWNYEINLLTYSIEDSAYNVNSTNNKNCVLRINLTKAFYDYFLYDDETEYFRNQWNIYTAKNRTFILNFLKKSMVKFFNINNQQELIVYKKALTNNNSGVNIIYEKPDDLDTWEVYTNYKSSYEEVNEELILTISISDFSNSQIYPLFKIKRI